MQQRATEGLVPMLCQKGRNLQTFISASGV